MLDYDTVKQALEEATFIGSCRGVEQLPDGKLYVGFDVDESEDGDSWNAYCDIQYDLRELGYELIEVETEHDYVGGVIVEYKHE